jgi:monoamine oxidase
MVPIYKTRVSKLESRYRGRYANDRDDRRHVRLRRRHLCPDRRHTGYPAPTRGSRHGTRRHRVAAAEAGKNVTLLERRGSLGGRTHGVQVRDRAVARRIHIDDGPVTGVSLADGTVIPADAVVCAVPNSNIGGLLDELPECDRIYAAAEKLSYTPIVSVNLYLDRPLGTRAAMEALIGGTGVIDEVFDRQIMHGRNTDGGTWLYCLTTSGAYEQVHKSNQEIVDEQMAMLRRYYPAAKEANVVCGQVVRMPKATFSQVLGTHGLRPPQKTSVPSVVLAGDWTDTDWSATMESAAQSAAKAVDLLLALPPST